MKKIVMFIVGVSLLCFAGDLKGIPEETKDNFGNESTQLLCSEDMTELAQTWLSRYLDENPGTDIQVVQADNPFITLSNEENASLAILTQNAELVSDDATWKVMIGKNVLVPVISTNNPLLEKINTQGIKLNDLRKAMAEGNLNWNSLLDEEINLPLDFYCTTEPSVEKQLHLFKGENGTKALQLSHINVNNIQETLDRNPGAVVYCHLTDIINSDNLSFINGIQVLPFDRNDNGELDYMEDVYTNAGDFTRAVYIGKYPKCFCNNIYVVANKKPTDDAQLAFIEWMLTSGQQDLNEHGVSNLVSRESQAAMAMLVDEQPLTTAAGPESNFPFVWVAIGVVVLLSIVIALAFQTSGDTKKPSLSVEAIQSRSINDASIAAPAGLYYDKTHTWAFREKNGEVRVGIDDFFQHLTGPITNVGLKREGDTVKKGDLMLTVIREGKQLMIYAPVTGKIKVKNQNLSENPEALNISPFSDGWVYLIEPTNWEREMQFLKVAEKYKTWIKDEFARLKDFFASYLNPTEMNGATAYQDGGMIKDGVLAEMHPKVWEDFQTHFINTSR